MKISNLATKTSLEIEESDILVIEDKEDTKQITVKEFKEYLLNNGVTRCTKIQKNHMLDNVINSLRASKYIISELITYKMNSAIHDATSGDIYIALKDVTTDKWLTAEDIEGLLVPSENGLYSKNFIINVLVADVYVKSSNYSIHDASEIDGVIPEGNIGYIKAHFDGLTQNEIAGIAYNNIMITLENTEVTVVLPIEDCHEYEFIGDPELFSNNVPYVQNLG